MALEESGPHRSGMGSMPHDHGTSFRLWAPHAEAVVVMGSFNQWSPTENPMLRQENGYWYADIPGATIGNEYKYRIRNGGREFDRIDPYARQVTHSAGNGVIYNACFDWSGDHFELPPTNELVIYEMHLGTFNDKSFDNRNNNNSLRDSAGHLDYLRNLGVNAIELMPLAQFAGESSWGYNPSCVFAVETHYGGPYALKRFIRAAHAAGIGVILDVVYNHFGPIDLNLWQFDGWSENGLGGIYFYNDWRAETPWGLTRPDYGRPEVRQFILDNALMWLEEYHVDGLRLDMTLFMRNVRWNANAADNLPDGWKLIRTLNEEIHSRFRHRITIAEDLQGDDRITKPASLNGAGFNAQWSARFVHRIRETIIAASDENRSLESIRNAIEGSFNGDPFQRVIYSESHDDVANGQSRISSEIDPRNPGSWYAQKRSTLAAGLVFTSPGIPMLFQGQEFLEDQWFQDSVPLDWHKSEEFKGLVRLYRDLIQLRLNRAGVTRGLTGSGLNIFHQNQADNLLAFHRWHQGGTCDDVVVVVNLSHQAHHDYELGFPRKGYWNLRLNSDWNGYSQGFSNTGCPAVHAESRPDQSRRDGLPVTSRIGIGPYTILVFSQDANG
jgi:1,4-alpha-glucan branching enzyme